MGFCLSGRVWEERWIERVIFKKVVQYFYEVLAILGKHLDRVIKRVITMAEEVDQASIQSAVWIVFFSLNASREIIMPMENG